MRISFSSSAEIFRYTLRQTSRWYRQSSIKNKQTNKQKKQAPCCSLLHQNSKNSNNTTLGPLFRVGHLIQRADSLKKTLMLGKMEGRRRRGAIEDEMVGWHRWLNGHDLEEIPGDSEGQGSLACCSPWGPKESNTTEQLSNNNTLPVGILLDFPGLFKLSYLHGTYIDLSLMSFHSFCLCSLWIYFLPPNDKLHEWKENDSLHFSGLRDSFLVLRRTFSHFPPGITQSKGVCASILL